MTITEPATAGAERPEGWELPTIVSVDDHVEPPHVWETWLPERFRRLGRVHRGLPGHADGDLHAHRLVLAHARHLG